MALDAGIYGLSGRGVKSVAEYDAEAQARQANKLALLLQQGQLADRDQSRLDANALRAAYQGLTGDAQQDYNALLKVSPKSAFDLRESQNKSEKARLDATKTQVETEKERVLIDKERIAGGLKKFEIVGQLMGGVRDQATYDQARQQAAQTFGPEFVANMPPIYNPQEIEGNRQRAMSVQQRLEQEWKQKGYDRDMVNDQERVRQFGVTSTETARSHRATEGIAGGHLALARTREGREAAAPRGVFDPERGLLIDPRTGTSRPVTAADGTPIGPRGESKTLPPAVVKQVTEARDNAATIDRLNTSFKKDYAGKGVFGIGADASMAAKGNLGLDADSVAWWKDYRKNAELVERHSLFGAALTPGEQSSWRSADIAPGMAPDVVKRNLKTRADLAKKVAEATQQDMIDAGHSAGRVTAIGGRGTGVSTTSADPLGIRK